MSNPHQMNVFWKVFPALAGGWLLAGCTTSKPLPPKPETPPPAQSATELKRRVEAHARYADALIHEMNDEPVAAADDYYQAALLDPGDEDLATQAGEELWEHGHPEKAIEVLSRAGAYPGASGALFARLGFFEAQTGKPDAAIAANRQAVRRSPELVAGWQNLSLELLRKKQTAAALGVLQQAVAQTNTGADFQLVIAEVLVGLSRENPDRKTEADALALQALARADQLNPRDTEARLRLADGMNLLGKTGRAAEIYSQLLNQTDGQPELQQNLRNRLTDLYLKTGDQARAMEQLQAILRDDPANPAANFELGELAYDQDRLEMAADFFHKTLLLRPDFEQAYYDLAQTQLAMDQPDEALATLAEARKKYPDRYSSELLCALADARLKSFDAAIAHFTTAEILAKSGEPDRLNEQFYYEVGATYEAKGDIAQAEKYLQKSLALAPDFADAQNYLGYMWADRGTNLVEARRLIEMAVKTAPNNPAYLDSLAWVLFKLKQPDKALPPMLKAIGLNGRPDPLMLDHLGEIYLALGRRADARDAWQRSLAAEPSEAVRKKLDSTPVP
jgi:tetratricopeptide (TPR) repeat protein